MFSILPTGHDVHVPTPGPDSRAMYDRPNGALPCLQQSDSGACPELLPWHPGVGKHKTGPTIKTQ